ncbi:phosphorylase family protein [Paenibacillus agricola]|nr:hypothetical protein [Paenibacillus agricola]
MEDNHEKMKNIGSVISHFETEKSCDIVIVSDIISAKKELRNIQYDLFILDIQVPNRFDSEIIIDGGIRLLKEIKGNVRNNIPANIICLTAHTESFQDATNIFENNLVKIIKYDETSTNWEKSLSSSINDIFQYKEGLDKRKKDQFEYHLAIICALEKVELESIKNTASTWEVLKLPNDNQYYYKFSFNQGERIIKGIAAAANQMGMPATTTLSMKIQFHFKPNYLVMTGIAAGVYNKVDLGDVLVPDPSWDYGNGKYVKIDGVQTFLQDPIQIRIDDDVRAILNEISKDNVLLDKIRTSWTLPKPQSVLKIHIGPVGSGSAVLADGTIIESIKKQNRKLLGVDMEVYGLYYAMKNSLHPHPKVFALKSVCDFADHEKSDDFQHYAAYTSIQILKEISLNYLEYDPILSI